MTTSTRKPFACSIAVLAAVSIALTVCIASAQEADKAWKIGPRTLPPPAGASEQLRKHGAEQPVPVASGAPKTMEGWKAAIAKGNAEWIAGANKFIEQAKVNVTEETVAGVHVYRLTPPEVAPENAKRLFVHIHGGAFILGGGRRGLNEAAQVAAMDDVIAVWHEVIKSHQPGRVALGGSSAGANLVLVATLRMKELKLPLASALFVDTPAADLNKAGDARFINEGIDHALVSWDKGIAGPAMTLYVGDKKYDDPYISPIFGDFKGFPPTYLISGTRDLMLSDTVRTHRKLRQAGVAAEVNVYEGFAHADYIHMYDTPEGQQHYAELSAFLSRHLAK